MLRKMLFVSSALLCASAFAEQPGYVTQPGGGHVMNPYGLCWRSSFWTPDQAVSPCDASRQVAAPAPAPRAAAPLPPVAAEPKLEPAPAPVAVQEAPAPAPIIVAPAPVQPSYEKVTLSADVLFDFNKATLKEGGRQQLEQLAERLRGASLDEIRIVGHADRIGGAQYNQRISEERANSVRAYLESRTAARSMKTAGKGKLEPVTANACKGMGAESGANRRLVECLQPDRRVDIELFGVRTAEQPARPGAQPASFSGSTR
jgi:OOP family OmpA-OmpF porin